MRCLECGAETAEVGQFCGRCGAPTGMPAADPVPAVDDRPGSVGSVIWRRPGIIAVAAIACLATTIIIISGKPDTPSRHRAAAPPTAPAAPSASTQWTYDTGAGVIRPAVTGGTVYIGSDDGTVEALDAATGSLRWTYTTGSYDVSGPAVAGGTVYVGGDDGTVHALDAATGRLRWTHATADATEGSPAVAGGTVYVGGDDGMVHALDAATGRLRWTYTTGSSVESSPAAAGGTVYVGSDDGKVYALDVGS